MDDSVIIRSRVSIGICHQRKDDLKMHIETNVRNRRSCSLPDLFNTDQYENDIADSALNTDHYENDIADSALNTDHYENDIADSALNTDHYENDIADSALNTDHYENDIADSALNMEHFENETTDSGFPLTKSCCPPTSDSTDPKLSVIHNDDQTKQGKHSLGSFQVYAPLCGKEHMENPCYICLKDNEIYCSVCVHMHNFHCHEKVNLIPEMPPELRKSICNETVRDLKVMRERFRKVKNENEEQLDNLNNLRKEYIKSVMKYKNTVLQLLDMIEKEAVLQMDIVFRDECKKTEDNLQHLDREIDNIDSCLKVLGDYEAGYDNLVVHEVQDARKQLRSDENTIRDYHKATNRVEFTFQPLHELVALLSDCDRLWKVERTETETCHFPNPCSCDRSYQDKMAEFEKEVSVRITSWGAFDRELCCITGCEFMPNGNLLLCDNNNKKVKLFDKRFKYISAHGLPSLPWDIAVLNTETAVVTMPDRRLLQFISVTNKIALKQSVTLSQNCWGVASSNDNIIVTCWTRDTAEILVLNLQGTLKRIISSFDGMTLRTPWFTEARDDMICVTDWGTYITHFITTSGSAVNNFRSTNLTGPVGLTFDPEGNVYVCGRDSNNIHQLSPDGNYVKILLSEKDGLHRPLNLCLNKAEDKLIVTSWMSDKLTVFRLQ